MVKIRLENKKLYLQVLEEFKQDTNLSRIKNKLNIKKQNLNYYIAKLKHLGFITHVGEGWYEVTEKGKNPTKYGNNFIQDDIRGHAYIWTIELIKIPSNWNERINILEKNKINFKLVGALKSTPRIKALGRKIWLCNNHIRIFDVEKASYYGKTAEESQLKGKIQAFRILRVLENKLGISLSNDKLKFQKEHYAIIKNDLAKHHNEKGIVMRISDENGEWLLIDDSLEEGGELENTGKAAFKTNPLVKNWWNDHKKHNFEVTSSYVLDNINKLTESGLNNSDRMNELLLITKALVQEVDKLKNK